jgi:Flp pilus assembly protein CpaB
MKRRLITVILFAVLAAAGSSTMLFKLISSNTPRPVTAATSTVLVAAHDLTPGALIGEADVREAQWPITEGSPWLAKRQDVVGASRPKAPARASPRESPRACVR